jgi:hypothetical protein
VPWHPNGPWTFGVKGGWLDAPQIGFYGIGMIDDAPRANFGLSKGYVTATAGLRPSRWVRLHGEVSYDDFKTEGGSGQAPSIETLYSDASAPGLLSDPAFIRTEATAAIDWRLSPNYTRRGGFYGVTLATYTDRDDRFSFRRVDGELIQHIPLVRENWVISLRGRVQTILDDDDVVPYFLLPELGSGRTLRAYSTGRFRDRHSLLTSAELRWIPNRTGLDMAIFYDAGKVASRREDLDFNGLKASAGASAHDSTDRPPRHSESSWRKGRNGWHLVLSSSAAF